MSKNKLSKKEVKAKIKANDKQLKAKEAKQSNKVDSKKEAKKEVAKPVAKEVKNIFTALGLIAKHRALPFQLVRHYDEVTVIKNKTQFPYEAEIQLKSVFCAVLVTKEDCTFWSRTGAQMQNLEALGQAFKVKKQGIYLAELYVNEATASLEKLATFCSPFRKNALTAPQKTILDDKATLVVTDYLTVDEFTKGKSELPLGERRAIIRKSCKKVLKKINFALPATKLCKNEEELREFSAKCISKGNNGINIKGTTLPYVCGHQNFHYMQMVQGASHNLKCVGYEEGEGKLEGQVANLLFTYRDGEIKAPLGRTYSAKDSAKMLEVLKSDGKGKKKKAKKGKKIKTASSPLGYVWEVTGLEENSKGVMKLPTVGKFTDSKAEF